MPDLKLAKIRTTQNNIRRYRRLLETELTDLERQYIQRRLSEECAELEALAADTFPISFVPPPTTSETDR